MIVRYNTDSGEILGYGTIGFVIPDEVPNNEGYLHWFGVEPSPKYNYIIQDGAVVLKSEDDRATRYDSILARHIRAQRGTLLAQSDYVILPDAPYSDATQSAYRTYRQELRDLPAQAGFPNNVTWPAKPT